MSPLRRALSLSLLLSLAGCTPKVKESTDAATTVASTANATSSAVPSADASATTTTAAGIRMVVATEDTDTLTLIRTERLKAKAEGRVLVVYAGAGWCEPCKRFKEEVHTGRLDAKLPKITLLAFDADRDTDRLGTSGYRFSFIPFVALPGPDGHALESDEARGKGSNSWQALVSKLEAWQSRAAP